MKAATYEELNNVLKNLCEERAVLQSQMEENNLHILETQSINKKIQESEEEDFRIFSPRKNKNLYKDELNQANTEKEDYETQNSQLLKEIDKLNTIIRIMQNVVEETETDKETEKKYSSDNCRFTDSQIDLYEVLEHILHRVELSIKFMNQDSNRARMELLTVSQNLQKLLHQE